ncbi:MAG: PD-(D/E)XK nuclease family protein [Candidatus Omnitrophota bacterium]
MSGTSIQDKVMTYSFCDRFMDRFTDDLQRIYLDAGRPLERLVIVFGGRRPGLFLKRELARRLGKGFVPPRLMTIDEFMSLASGCGENSLRKTPLDDCYTIYRLAGELCPEVLKGRSDFTRFLPWAREILRFIDQLDLECVADERLLNVEKSAAIGYDVPADINRLLTQIAGLRRRYHETMAAAGMFSRGYRYILAAERISRQEFPDFDEIWFANFFYLNRAEEAVISHLIRRDSARLFLQGDQRRWPVFQRISRLLDVKIHERREVPEPEFDLHVHAAFDRHSQAGMAAEILRKLPDPEQTVVVLPDPDMIIPLLSELSGREHPFNISMGYPLSRGPLSVLLQLVFSALTSRDERGYYARDYLKLIAHPIVKNLTLDGEPQRTRILLHKIEEALTGRFNSGISGKTFFGLDELESCREIFDQAARITEGVKSEDFQSLLVSLHDLILRRWEAVRTMSDFSSCLQSFTGYVVENSRLRRYPLNEQIAVRMYDLAEEIKQAAFAGEPFEFQDLVQILQSQLDQEMIAFRGSPLRGLQILGLFETRSLSFDQVIVLDANEGVLPRIHVQEALIPRDVMVSLGLDRLEEEEQIQRYGFMRLISAAKDVHLIYQHNREFEPSRFVEELIWHAQQRQQNMDAVSVTRPRFRVVADQLERSAEKTPEMIAFLRQMRYSASSVNLYLRNPYRFYQQYVLGLREWDDVLDEPENRQIGTYIHQVLEEAFRPLVGSCPQIDAPFRQDVQNIADRLFEEQFGRSRRADMFLLKSVVDERLARFLEREADVVQRPVEEILFVEETFNDTISLTAGDISFVFKVDRVDRLRDGRILLLDYKTGSVSPGPKGPACVSAARSREEIAEEVCSFQLPLYYHYLRKTFPADRVQAGFYNIRTLEIRTFPGPDWRNADTDEVFLQALDRVIAEILDPNIPFQDTGD